MRQILDGIIKGTILRTDAAAEPAEPIAPSRRGFLTGAGRLALGGAALAAGGSLLPAPALAATKAAAAGSRRALAFQSLHTGETLKVTYWQDGRYVPTALEDVNHILRDWRTGEIGQMDPKLLDILHQLKGRLRADGPFHIISGYRCPRTNAMLASRSGGVAKKSLHMEGKAIDIALPGRKLAEVRQAALELKLGGVGYYPKSGFVHVDTGRVRQWG